MYYGKGRYSRNSKTDFFILLGKEWAQKNI
jgi:hypothetical protein